MKKVSSILLSLVLLLACVLPAFAVEGDLKTALCAKSDSFGAYKHVFILGVDGAGSYFQKAKTPNFDRIFAKGAVDYTARAEVYSDSGPNWGSILTGVSFLKTLYTNGNISPEGEEKPEGFHMRKYPTIFGEVHKAFPDAALASYSNWENINFGIIEDDIGVQKFYGNTDELVTKEICAYLDAGNQPTLFFSQFGSVDDVGHALGSDSKEYVKQIEIVDGYLGEIYKAIARNGLLKDSLIIVVADHGHRAEGGHGRFSMRESMATLAVAGKTVVSGSGLDKHTRNRDVSAIALYALGICKPLRMSARLPGNLFADTCGELRPVLCDPLDAIVSPVMWLYTLSTAEN